MMASRLTQWVPQEQKSVTMKSLQKVSKCQNMTPILEEDLSVNASLRQKIRGEQLFGEGGEIFVKVTEWLTLTDEGLKCSLGVVPSIQAMVSTINGVYSPTEVRYLIRFNTHESTKTLTKEEVAYIFSLNRWGCILEEFNGRVLTLEDLYEEFDICPCGSGLVPRWFNGGSLFPSNFVTCINCAMEKFIEKGYREGVVFKDHHFSFFSATTGLECFDMESIIKGKVFPSAMSSQLFPYSFNFTIKGGDHCFGCDKMTKDWLVLNGWGWKDEI